jgi:phosphohistidine phosphatase
MKIMFIRHIPAHGHFLANEDEDFLREILPRAKKKFKPHLKMMTKIFESADVVFTSPLVRAVQTAEIVHEAYPDADLELMADLHILDNPAHLVELISFLPLDGNYIFVGHEPHLSQVIAALLSLHPEHDFMTLKKGGFCIIEGGLWQGFSLKLLAHPKMLSLICEK